MEKVEEWRDVPGWEGHYQVSDLGRVRSMDRVSEFLRDGRFPIRRKCKGKVLAATIGPNGYTMFSLSNGSGNVDKRTGHELVAAAFLGPRPAKHDIRHGNNIRHDNRLTNLQYGTRSENEMDKHLHGTMFHAYGEAGPAHKLTNEEVLWIRANYRPRTALAFAAKFNVSRPTIYGIIKRRHWPHI